MMASFIQFVQAEAPQAACGGLSWARLRALLPRFAARANRPDEMHTKMHTKMHGDMRAEALESR
jgi:hypothetical protein